MIAANIVVGHLVDQAVVPVVHSMNAHQVDRLSVAQAPRRQYHLTHSRKLWIREGQKVVWVEIMGIGTEMENLTRIHRVSHILAAAWTRTGDLPIRHQFAEELCMRVRVAHHYLDSLEGKAVDNHYRCRVYQCLEEQAQVMDFERRTKG